MIYPSGNPLYDRLAADILDAVASEGGVEDALYEPQGGQSFTVRAVFSAPTFRAGVLGREVSQTEPMAMVAAGAGPGALSDAREGDRITVAGYRWRVREPRADGGPFIRLLLGDPVSVGSG
ncbi:head-tail joining protein [Salinarimonas rosea]|uniref:head-tail joining protein n=1 Tax=Salinarimonas rosea TaxID=552063 RepID=UPI00041592AB|nr:hypothetical protein [Salinarimonas rosea]